MSYELTPHTICRREPKLTTENGVYLLKGRTPEEDPKGLMMIVVCINKKFYSIQIDQELEVEGFTPNSRLYGPLK